MYLFDSNMSEKDKFIRTFHIVFIIFVVFGFVMFVLAVFGLLQH